MLRVGIGNAAFPANGDGKAARADAPKVVLTLAALAAIGRAAAAPGRAAGFGGTSEDPRVFGAGGFGGFTSGRLDVPCRLRDAADISGRLIGGADIGLFAVVAPKLPTVLEVSETVETVERDVGERSAVAMLEAS